MKKTVFYLILGILCAFIPIGFNLACKSYPPLYQAASTLVLKTEIDTGKDLAPLRKLIGLNFRADKETLVNAYLTSDVDTLRILLSAGFDPTTVDIGDESILIDAVERASDEVLLTLVVSVFEEGKDLPMGIGPLLATKRSSEFLRKALDFGVSLTGYDKRGYGALSAAMIDGKLDAAVTLASDQTLLNQKDKDGDLPLIHAVRIGKMKLINALLKSGANPNGLSDNGKTGLMEAMRLGRRKTVIAFVEELKKNNALKRVRNIQDSQGRSALDFGSFRLKSYLDSEIQKSENTAKAPQTPNS